MIIWLQFLVCTLVILFSGIKLSRYGDIIAEKSGLGRTWIGVVLMASVTSLPELITGISSVAVFKLPDIAAGDALGSCMFNLLIIAMLDFTDARSPISTRTHQGQTLTAGLSLVAMGIILICLLVGSKIPRIGWIGLGSIMVFAVYLIGMRLVFLYEKKRAAEFFQEVFDTRQYSHISARRAYVMFGLYALFIIAAATWLPSIGEKIAVMTGLGNTFVGSIFIALSTSLPEVVVSFAALRMGAVDLAIGNILGSNLFNMAILSLDDFFYFPGPILTAISDNHKLTVSAAMTMTAIVVIGMTYRAGKKFFFFAWDAVGLLIVYGLVTMLLYSLR